MGILKIVVLAFFIASSAHAESFDPEFWREGSHFFVGSGLNTGALTAEEKKVRLGAGGHIRSEWTFPVNETYAGEIGAGFSFNVVDGFTVWDTQLTGGVRIRLPDIPTSTQSSPYARIFAGVGPTVIVFGDVVPPPFDQQGIQRLQFVGPIGGAGMGLFRKAPSGQVWYMEITWISHFYRSQDVIKSNKDVPVVVERLNDPEYDNLQALQLSFGLLAF